jgi:peptidyl-prolyl cis-trans isomerase C
MTTLISNTSATSCSVKPAIATKPKTVSVNGVAIPRSAIARETQNHPAAKPIEAWQAAARALVIRELLLQEARRLHITPDPIEDDEGRRETDDEALMRQVVEREVATPEPDEATCRRYFDQNRMRFVMPDLFEVAHILILVRAEPGADAEAALKADALLAALRGDPAAFAALARLHSACPSREVGGSLGQIGPGQTIPEFENALPGLPVGRIAPKPVRTRYGLHIVRLDRRIEGRQLPFDLAMPRIAAFLADRVRRVAERQYVSLLAGRATIEGVELEAAASPLLQ